ncbi:MAG: cell wall-binding repeat-containing protein, partial [Actinobacteria bacterium]|nr:cell wall-binding repeat-containing protein [Actinomycetota bacterium]
MACGRSGNGLAAKKSVRGGLVCTGLMLVTALWVILFSGAATAAPEFLSLRGDDRYDTAVMVSQAGYISGVEAVVLATGEDFPDALSAAPLAAAYGGPVLLTHSGRLDEIVQTEIARLAPAKILVIGLGPEVVAQVTAAFPDLAASGGVVVLVGANRYDTARLVADEVKARLGSVTGVVVAPGDSFADAVSAAPLAAAQGWPILLTPAGGPLPEETSQALADLRAPTALAVGTRVSLEMPDVASTYIVGEDRYDTCARIADYALGLGLSFSQVGVAPGDKFPDALAAGPYLAKSGGILLLTKSSAVPAATSRELLGHAEEVQMVTYFGLDAAVTGQVRLLLSVTDLPEGFGFSTLRTGSEGPEVLW